MPVKITFTRRTPLLDAMLKSAPARAAQAINRTLEEAQAAQRQVVASNFVDRRSGFLRKMVKIAPGDRATASRLTGSIRIIGPEGRENAGWYLARHDQPTGPQRRSGIGYSSNVSTRVASLWAIPTTTIRPNFSATVPRSLYPSSLRLIDRKDIVGTLAAKTHTTARGVQQAKGNRRTFVLFDRQSGAPLGIYQRYGASKLGGRGKSWGRRIMWHKGVYGATRDHIAMIWALRPTVRLKPRLRFYETVGGVVHTRMAINLQGFLGSSSAGSGGQATR